MNRQSDQWNRRERPVIFKCIWKFSITLHTRINPKGLENETYKSLYKKRLSNYDSKPRCKKRREGQIRQQTNIFGLIVCPPAPQKCISKVKREKTNWERNICHTYRRYTANSLTIIGFLSFFFFFFFLVRRQVQHPTENGQNIQTDKTGKRKNSPLMYEKMIERDNS